MLVKYVFSNQVIRKHHIITLGLDIFIEVNEHVMKPLEEYMLFTKTGAEKVNVSNSHGVRSAQCNPYFDVPHKILSATNINISQVSLWVRIKYSLTMRFYNSNLGK